MSTGLMATTRVAQAAGPKGMIEIAERPIPEARPGTVRIKVTERGVCHSDTLAKEGLRPGTRYPRIPGQEITGTLDAVGDGVTGWSRGHLVGVGWHGGYCGQCEQCRRGYLFACVTQPVTGMAFECGYGEYMIAPISAVARFPEGLSPVDAAPLLCAGITTFNALRNSCVRSLNETLPPERVSETCERMISGMARSRAVLTMGGAK
jgi:D-arabinose 1-dehydrogenase-like Zn-dependent alcohol dehydrogenase